MLANKKILDEYVINGKLNSRVHPTLPLTIYNYSPETQYERDWDSITLMCRGLVVDSTTGEIVAKPFPKFFNYEEHHANEIPNENFEVYEKMDGSLGIIFHYEGGWLIATRGSFTSEQAIKGKEMLDKLNKSALMPGYTYLAEIIYPENRIVVDYGGEEKLVVLGAYNNETGVEVNVEEMVNSGWEVVKMYKTWGEDWKTLKKEISKDKEGYVIRFSGGMRMKIKGDEYVRLHRVLTQCSSYDIWENLKTFNKLPSELLENIPDEFYRWAEELEISIRLNFNAIKIEHETLVSIAKKRFDNKKDFALYVNGLNPETVSASIMFTIWDEKDPSAQIWDMVKPRYQKPFSR